ncbi:MAG: hypothetical protein R3A79_24710 [Nannocystaceae bacterium]
MTEPAPATTPPRRTLRRVLTLLACVAAVVLIVLALTLRPESGPTPAPRLPPTAEAAALLGDLDAGATIGAFEVEAIVGPGAEGRDPEAILIHVRAADTRLAVTILPRGAAEHPAPAQTERHDLFFGHLSPDDAPLDAPAVDALLADVAEIVRAHE